MNMDRNIQLAAAGNVNAFEELYLRQRRRVYSLCLSMTGSTSAAEDLTQEVFVQLFRKLKTFRGESSFSTWLHRLTVNQVLMHFRKLAVRPEETTDDDANQIAIQRGTEKSSSMSLIDHISLNEVIDQLAPGYRAVFILHDIAGYEHDQIGKILGCAVGTSKSQLHKARMKLRQLLTKKNQSNTEEPMRTSPIIKRRFAARRRARGLRSPRQVTPDVTPSFIREVIVKGFFFVLILLLKG